MGVILTCKKANGGPADMRTIDVLTDVPRRSALRKSRDPYSGQPEDDCQNTA